MDLNAALHVAGLFDFEYEHLGNNWMLLTAVSSTGLQRNTHNIAFFNSNATWSTVHEAATLLQQSHPGLNCFPIIQNSARSLVTDLVRVSRELGTHHAAITLRNLLLDALTRTIRVGAAGIWEEPRFVEPTLRTSKEDTEALNTLTSWVRSLDVPGKRLGVVVAGAGVGKTTIVRELYVKLMRQKVQKGSIPLLVEPHDWAKFAASSSDLTLRDIWKNSFDSQYSALISDEVLEACVSRGAITVILDGFDELCTKLSAQFSPSSTIESIMDISASRENESKILITSRQTFWNDLVEPALKAECELFELLPFNRQQTESYWQKAFPQVGDERKRERARTIHARLETQSSTSSPFREQLGAVPAVIAMVAECADEQQPVGKYGKYLDDDRPLDGLIKYLCAREHMRRLPSAEAEAQLRWLTDLALELGSRFSADELLDYARYDLDLQRPEFTSVMSHALLSVPTGGDGSTYKFRFDFLADYLPARWMAQQLADPRQALSEKAITLLARQSTGSSQFVDYLAQEIVISNASKTLRELFCALQTGSGSVESREAKSGLFHVALRCVDRLLASGTRNERTQMLFNLLGLPQSEMQLVLLRGTITSLDLSGIAFTECEFRDVAFSRCRFGSSTKFKRCKFDGRLEVDNPGDFSTVEIDEYCHFSPAAFETVQTALGVKKVAVSESLILDNFQILLCRFKQGLGFKSLQERDLRRGRLSQSPLRDDILESLEKHKIISFHNLGAMRRSGVAINTDCIAEVQRFLDNRLVAGHLAYAIDQVKARFIDKRID